MVDKSPLIDRNWDLLNLPLEDCSVDCFVCNAVLEHVFEPQLAIFEMHRTLKIGGQIWAEVPFNQFYHAHPLDFRRWTVQGLEWEMRRFDRVSSGMTAGITYEVRKIADIFKRESKATVEEYYIASLEAIATTYTETTKSPRLYSGSFFWGTKRNHSISDVECAYMQLLRADVLRRSEEK